jgi:hypothetical protein
VVRTQGASLSNTIDSTVSAESLGRIIVQAIGGSGGHGGIGGQGGPGAQGCTGQDATSDSPGEDGYLGGAGGQGGWGSHGGSGGRGGYIQFKLNEQDIYLLMAVQGEEKKFIVGVSAGNRTYVCMSYCTYCIQSEFVHTNGYSVAIKFNRRKTSISF